MRPSVNTMSTSWRAVEPHGLADRLGHHDAAGSVDGGAHGRRLPRFLPIACGGRFRLRRACFRLRRACFACAGACSPAAGLGHGRWTAAPGCPPGDRATAASLLWSLLVGGCTLRARLRFSPRRALPVPPPDARGPWFGETGATVEQSAHRRHGHPPPGCDGSAGGTGAGVWGLKPQAPGQRNHRGRRTTGGRRCRPVPHRPCRGPPASDRDHSPPQAIPSPPQAKSMPARGQRTTGHPMYG